MKDRWDEVTVAVDAAGWEVGDCHDLLHRAFSPVCWKLPGGPNRHLGLWWRYQGRSRRRRWACPRGRHRYLPYWDGLDGNPDSTPDGLICLDCASQPSPSTGENPSSSGAALPPILHKMAASAPAMSATASSERTVRHSPAGSTSYR